MTRYLSGLDLGQSNDFTALVVVEQTPRRNERGGFEVHHAVRHIERFKLGTSYPDIVAAVRDLFARSPLAQSLLVIDRTGVGRPVHDLFKASGIRASVTGWTITAGQNVGDGTVPKKDLVGAIQATLGARRLQIAPGLPLADTLAKELEMFRVKVTADRNETFSAGRERDHDDLVLGLALAVWTGERLGVPGLNSVPQVLGNISYGTAQPVDARETNRVFSAWVGTR